MEQATVISARLTLSPTRKVRVFRCWFSTVRALFTSSLACSVAWTDPDRRMTMLDYTTNIQSSAQPCQVRITGCCTTASWNWHKPQLPNHLSLQAWPENAELHTCLLNCMIPRVGKTHALAGGMISESAKLTHCSTWAAAWGVVPRRASLLTAV